MLKNKKADSGIGMSLGFIGRLLLAIAALTLVLMACNRVREVFYSTDSKSFEVFVDGINEMSSDTIEEFALQLDKGSAIVGFSEGTDAFECYGCRGIGEQRIDRRVIKPADNQCSGTACVCLCDNSFEIKSAGGVREGECKGKWICKKLNVGIDISPKTFIGKKFNVFGDKYWINGFLFSRRVLNMNGLVTDEEEMAFLHVEKKGNLIGVCNEYLLNYNEDKLGLGANTCINKDYTP